MLPKLLLTILLLLAKQAQADWLVDGSLLGLEDGQLKSSVSNLHRLGKPLIGPRGLRGVWGGPVTRIGNLQFDSTFFMRTRKVERIEQQHVSNNPACADLPYYDPLISEMKQKYATGLTAQDQDDSSNDPAHQSIIWRVGGFDVLMHIRRSSSQCTVLIIYEPHVEKDASEL